MKHDNLRKRTKAFALNVIDVCCELPEVPAAKVIQYQLLKAGTSVGANYRAAARARSRADFVAKMGIVEEEADEAAFWMELLIESEFGNALKLRTLHDEANQLVAIAVSSMNTARGGPRK